MDLLTAFDINPGEVISLVGGGGKTTLMFALARELVSSGRTVITTTTTKIYEPSTGESAFTLLLDAKPANTSLLRGLVDRYRQVTLAKEKIPEGKLRGIEPQLVVEIARSGAATHIIVEADGAKHHPLKAPSATEPVIPENTTLVIPVIGVEALNCALTEENVFRASTAAALLGLPLNSPVSARDIAILLTHPRGIAKGSPPGSRIIPLINKMDLVSSLLPAGDLARTILGMRHPGIAKVVLGQANSTLKPVWEIINQA